ncbi:MAG: S8 family serine peptidase [Ginsengibacter sp.]
MKQLSLLFCFFILLSSTQAQKTNFYYFGNTKIFVGENKEKIYVRLKEGASERTRQSLRNDFQLSDKAFTILQSTQFMVIDLKDLDKNRQKSIISDLSKTGGDIQMSRPVVIAPDGGEIVIDEQFYVKLKQSTSLEKLKAFAIQKKCIINESPYKYDNKVYLLKAGVSNNFDGLQLANAFYESGLFEYAEPDFRMLNALHSVPPPDDSLFNLQWALKNTGSDGQYNGTAGGDIKLLEAWDITMGSPMIKIAVIDEGVDRAHPDLVNNILPIGFGLLAQNDSSGDVLSNTRSHGTSCAGIIAAEANNKIGGAGIAPNCKIIPVNLTINTGGTFGTSSQLALCLDWAWAEGGADILSNSWGGGTSSSLIKDAIHRAVIQGRGGKGSMVVFSAGNYDAGVSNPGCYPDVIAVGAMSMCYQKKSPSSCDGEAFWGSNYGTGLDISAPGVKIATTRVTGTGASSNPDYTLTFNGTSSAAPMVAGVAALVLSVNGNLTQVQAREVIERSARKVGAYSYSIVKDQANGSWSSELGYGMVNAQAAVISAQNPVFCAVKVSAAGALQICSSASVLLKVDNPVAADSYTWRNDAGTVVKTGISYAANKTGNYNVTRVTNDGCIDTSYKFNIIVSAPEGALVANAGKDTTIDFDAKIFLGSGPSASGGTAIINPMRGLVNDIGNDRFLRFDPMHPSTNYQFIKEEFNVDIAINKFYAGAAATPFGLFMMDRSGLFVKIDTASGIAYPVGTNAGSLLFNGMTYDYKTGKIFAVGSKSSKNTLYEINALTGASTFIVDISGLESSSTIWTLSVDSSGQLYGLQSPSYGDARMIKIDKSSGKATFLNNPGFKAYYAQGGDVDPLDNTLYQSATTAPIGNNNYSGSGLWKMDKETGVGTLIGSITEPYVEMDALSFAGKEYKYQWSPSTNLSNPNDANPQFTGVEVGNYVYTLTVTDLCGNTATDKIKVTVQKALPVTLLDFSGQLKDKIVSLKWSVQNEVNFDRYQVERSTDGNSFTTIGEVAGKKSVTESEYHFDDQSLPSSPTIYYRLRMVDIDGKNGQSNVVFIRNDANVTNGLVVIKPNPFTSSLTVQYESLISVKLKGQVLNSRGESIKQFTANITPGVNEILIQGDNMPAGVYLLKLEIADKIITRKIVKR